MKSEALDISIVSRGSVVWLYLNGPFNNEQAHGINEKIQGLIDDGNRRLIIDMENVVSMDDTVAPMFLSLVNLIKGKGGDIRFVFKNEAVSRAFAPFRNLLRIYPDALSLTAGGLFGLLRSRGKVLSRKTGVRLSRPVALVLLFTLCGWFISLAFIIFLQNQRLREQEHELTALVQWKQQAALEIKTLHERIKPMEQLGLLKEPSGTRGNE
jgi:anti-anti-sigma factor